MVTASVSINVPKLLFLKWISYLRVLSNPPYAYRKIIQSMMAMNAETAIGY